MEDDPTNPAQRETLSTSLIEAKPEAILHMPEDNLVPFWLSLALVLLLVGILLTTWWLAVVGAALSMALIMVWLWPSADSRAGERRK